MNDSYFDLIGVFVFFSFLCWIILVFIARYSIIEISEKIDKSDFLLLFPDLKNRFPFNARNINIKTQLKLYKILFLNQKNIRNIVGLKQKYFFWISILWFFFIVCLFFLSLI